MMDCRRLPLFAGPILALAVAPGAPAQPRPPSPAATEEPSPAPPRTLSDCGSGFDHNGWFVAPTFGVTTVDGHLDTDSGVKGAWLINRKLGLGLAGYGLGGDGVRIDKNSQGFGREVRGGYGGVLLQYVWKSKSVVHGYADATIGAGGACVEVLGDGDGDCAGGRGFFVFEPTANVEINVLTFMRVAVGGGYRLVVGPESEEVASSDLSGMVARFTLAFGEF